MSIRTIALVAIVLSGIASSSAAPAQHLRARNDCPIRMRRSVAPAGATTGVGAKVISSFTVSDLAAFTAAQAQAHAAPPAPTPAYGYQADQQAGVNTWHDSQLAVATGDFGDFFDTTGAAAAAAGGAAPTATGEGGLTTGIGAKVVSSFTVSDLNSFTAAQAGATPAPSPAPDAKAGGAATTGIGAKIISSFTVSDLAAFTAGASSAAPPAPSGTWAAAPTPAQGVKTTGVGARVVCSFTVGSDVVASATAALGSQGAQPTASSLSAPPAPVGADAPAVSGTASSAAAPQSSRIKVSRTGTFSPTTTGIAAKPLGFATTSTVIGQAAPSGPAAPSSASSGPPAPAPTTAPASDAASAVSSSSSSAPAAETPVAAAQEAAAEIPGQKLAVMPIGLGVFGAIAGLGMIVVGWVTWERKKYRKQFRARKETEAINDALNMRSSRMV